VVAVEILGWVGSALLVYSVLQTRILRLRLFNGVASALLVIFNAAIAVWPMVALNVTLTAINVSISCACSVASTTRKPSRWSRSPRTRPT
jgi:presenilin-like A22 family membrane protease